MSESFFLSGHIITQHKLILPSNQCSFSALTCPDQSGVMRVHITRGRTTLEVFLLAPQWLLIWLDHDKQRWDLAKKQDAPMTAAPL